MYPYLFGNEHLKMYDIIGVFGYVLIFAFYLHRKNRFALAQKEKYCLWPLLLVQCVAFTFGGEWLGSQIGRATEFYGFLGLSAVFTVLLAVSVAGYPLRWLDDTVPLYLTLASVLKLGCFCSGCCYGLPCGWGMYNSRCDQTQFPMQLVEAVAYGLLLWALWRYRGKTGQRFALCVSGYAAIRFAVQFFRGDRPMFSAFHWMSAVVAAIGAALWLVCGLVRTPKQAAKNNE